MKKLVYVLAILILYHSGIQSQEYFSFGDSSTKLYASVPSTPLRIRAVPRFSYNIVSRVGGVYFEQTLTTNANISINYIPDNPDGYRLEVIANGIRYNPNIPDWQLVPIAKFSNTEHVAVVSLFGPKTSAIAYDITYHEAFENTLLGLRLLQADIMLMNIEEFYKLPKYEGLYTILGKGENNNYSVNETDLTSISEFMYALQIQELYNAWILNDKNLEITTNTEMQNLLSGDKPFYYFWKSEIDDEENYTKRLDLLQKYYENKIAVDLEKFRVNTSYFVGDTIMIGNKAYLMNSSSEKILENIEYDFTEDYYQIIEDHTVAKECEDINQLFKSSIYHLLEKINPMVFKATDNTMKFSAFFRYVRDNSPHNWAKFINTINSVEISPKIKTPTVLPKE